MRKSNVALAAADLCSRLVPVFFFSLMIRNNLRLVWELLGREGARDFRFCVAVAERGSVVVFLALTVVLFLVRAQAIRKASGLWPRVAAVGGAFLMTTATLFPRFDGGVVLSTAATALVLVGTCLSVVSLYALGRSFSIMAEARRLVTTGPYRVVRHPLYASEQIAIVGLALQFLSLPVIGILALQIGFQLWRMRNEEAVLGAAFPEYERYKATTARVIPGVY